MRRFAITAAFALACSTPTAPPVQVRIPEGATLSATADTLVSHGLLQSPRWFRWYARLRGRADEIKAGVYRIPPGLSATRLVRLLTEGRAALRRLVLPEGLMLSEVATAVSQQLGVPPAVFEAAAKDSALVRRTAPGATSLEGYLYPSTYLVRYGATAPELIDQMVSEFESHWRPEWNARLDTLRMTRHEIVILASIIEEEVRYGPDRTYVASVYTNRLRRHMRLQADPTVIYALGTRRRLFEKDYQHPTEESLRAALYPAETDFLYFVAQPDGKHVFSRTLKEHLAAIQAVRAPARSPRPPRSS